MHNRGEWEPIINNERIQNHINLIAETLYQIDTNDNNNSLFMGKTGMVLFLYYYWLFSENDKFLDKANSLLLKIINSGTDHYSLCNGNVGILWAIYHFLKNKFIDSSIKNMFSDIDEKMFFIAKKEMRRGRYDFLHSSLGIGMYFLEKDSRECKKYIEYLIYELEKIAIPDMIGYKWKSFYAKKGEEIDIINTGLSHGIASIIVFLSKAYTKKIFTKRSEIILNKAIDYLMSIKLAIPDKQTSSYFPSYIENEGNSPIYGRLSWCYGDLGIGISLWQAAHLTKDQKLEREATDILLHTTTRKNIAKENIKDAGICHGSAGIGHIYNRIYNYTKISSFKEASIFWINDIIKKAQFKDGYAGHKIFRNEDNGIYINSYGLLEGIAGIGLVLLSASSKIEPKWDSSFLLS